jgi:adenine phosphoribosyltransferase
VRSDLRDLLRRQFRWTDPDPEAGYLVSDRSGWWRTPEVLEGLGPGLAELFADTEPSVVIAPEVTGFLIGPLVARALRVGFVEAYKLGIAGGRRPIAEPMTCADVPADHRGEPQRLGVRSRHLAPGDRVLVVDDWAVTGAQIRALYAIVAELGATPIGTAVIVSECAGPVAAELRIRGLLTGDDV